MQKCKYVSQFKVFILYDGMQIYGLGEAMPKSVRLTEKEQETLYRHMIKLNKKMSDIGKRPVQETDIIHHLLENHTENVKADENGNLYLEM